MNSTLNPTSLHDLSRVAVIIPALNPEAGLLDLVRQLLCIGFGWLILVDDGSDEYSAAVFSELPADSKIVLLRHAVNCGKGRALKTAFNHCLVHYPELIGVVTADADGQHSPEDIANLGAQLSQLNAQEDAFVVLGVRDFANDIPLRSKLGNMITRIVFRVLYGQLVTDTQTGLRAFPLAVLRSLLTIPGEHYEYESGVLISIVAHRLQLCEIPISTIYIDGNRGSHFNPLIDSMRIYFVLLRFFVSSILTSIIDFVAFAIMFYIYSNILTSMLAGRGAALLVNFMANKKLVFKQQNNGIAVFLRYLALVVLLGVISYLMISEMQDLLGLNTLVAKVIAESVLFAVSFSVQREIVFADYRLERGNGDDGL